MMDDLPACYSNQLEEHQPVQKNYHMFHKPSDGNSYGEFEKFLVTLSVKPVIEQTSVGKPQWFQSNRKRFKGLKSIKQT